MIKLFFILIIIKYKYILRKLKDLQTFTNSLRYENIFKLVFLNPFDIIGNNLLRFLFKQVVEGLEVLDRGNYVYFDIKPKNFLNYLRLNIYINHLNNEIIILFYFFKL